MRQAYRLLIASLLIASLAAACGGGATATLPPATEGPVVVRVGWGGSPDTLNPGAAVLEEAYTLFELTYDSMDGTFSPDLEESHTVSDDGTVWTFKVRTDFAFHDGEPLTAQDVAFSYNFYREHVDFPYLNAYTGYFVSIEAPDDSTVIITLSEPIPNMESQLTYLYVLPEHIWAEHAEGAAATEFENTAMIGSGPFSMVEYRQNEFVRLAANSSHPLAPPKVDEVVFQTFENQDALVQALRTAQLDMIIEMPNTAVTALRDEPNIGLAIGAPLAPSVSDIIFNQIDPANCPPDSGVCTGHPALRDRQVRLALSHATDKQRIIDVVLLGLGSVGRTLIPDGLGVWFNDGVEDYAFDVALANSILDDAGYLDADGDGTRDMPDGSQPLSFRLNWPSDSVNYPRTAELLAEMWGQVGVRTEQQAMDPDALTSICCPAFDFDVILWGWGSDPDPSLLLSVMTTAAIPDGSSETGYSNPAYDDLYDQQATELNYDQRLALVHQMQQLVFDDVVYIIPYYEQAVQAYRTDRFTGWRTEGPKIELSDLSSLAFIEPVP
jgi:peptide/nickel transport system substrate-binding protein